MPRFLWSRVVDTALEPTYRQAQKRNNTRNVTLHNLTSDLRDTFLGRQ